MHELEQLIGRIEPIGGVAIDGIGYRSTTPKYAREKDVTSGAGSRKFGGRWNPIGIAAVYVGLSPETAMEETLAHFRYYDIPVHAAMPRTFVAIHARLSKVLDLTQGSVRRRIRISEDRLLNVDWRREMHAGKTPITQVVGRAAYEAGFEGLRMPSAVDDSGENLVVFPEKLGGSSRLEVLAAGDLQG